MIKLCQVSMFFVINICVSQLLYSASTDQRVSSIESLQSRCGRVIANTLIKEPESDIAQSFMHNMLLAAAKFPMIHYIDDILKREIGWRCSVISSDETNPAEQSAVAAAKLACSFDGKVLFSGSIGGMLRRWNIDSCSMQTFAKLPRSIDALVCSAGGDKVFARSSQGKVWEWTFSMGRKDVKRIGAEIDTPIACSADGSDLFAVFEDGFRSQRGQPIPDVLRLRRLERINAISCSAKGDRILVGTPGIFTEGRLFLCDVKTGSKLRYYHLDDQFPYTRQPVCNATGSACYWIYNRRYLATWLQSDREVYLWCIKQDQDAPAISVITCQADGNRIFLGTEIGEIYVRIGKDKRAYFIGAPVASDESDSSKIISLACSGDGSRLFAGSADLITMWSDYIKDLLQLDMSSLTKLFYAMKRVHEEQKPYTVDLGDKDWINLLTRYIYLQNDKLFRRVSSTAAASSSQDAATSDCIIS